MVGCDRPYDTGMLAVDMDCVGEGNIANVVVCNINGYLHQGILNLEWNGRREVVM